MQTLLTFIIQYFPQLIIAALAMFIIIYMVRDMVKSYRMQLIDSLGNTKLIINDANEFKRLKRLAAYCDCLGRDHTFSKHPISFPALYSFYFVQIPDQKKMIGIMQVNLTFYETTLSSVRQIDINNIVFDESEISTLV